MEGGREEESGDGRFDGIDGCRQGSQSHLPSEMTAAK